MRCSHGDDGFVVYQITVSRELLRQQSINQSIINESGLTGWLPGCFINRSMNLLSVRNCLAVSTGWRNRPSNRSRAHCKPTQYTMHHQSTALTDRCIHRVKYIYLESIRPIGTAENWGRRMGDWLFQQKWLHCGINRHSRRSSDVILLK